MNRRRKSLDRSQTKNKVLPKHISLSTAFIETICLYRYILDDEVDNGCFIIRDEKKKYFVKRKLCRS